MAKELNIGVIGLSEHGAAYTRIINKELTIEEQLGSRVVAVFHPPGNPDVEFSVEKLNQYQAVIEDSGAKMVDSMDELLDNTDAIMLLTNDGRPHLDQIDPVLKRKYPVYVDKPIADRYSNVEKIYLKADSYDCPIFSSSPLRYGEKIEKLSHGSFNDQLLGCDTFGPAPIQSQHVDLFWDGIHGIELLYTVMGPGCQSVQRVFSAGTDYVVGIWKNGMIGSFRGIREGRAGFGGRLYAEDQIIDLGKFEGYRGLVKEIVKFFHTKEPPMAKEETLEIYQFMEAAQLSKERKGQIIELSKTRLE